MILMLTNFVKKLTPLCLLCDFIWSLDDDDFYTVLRQLDRANLVMEYEQWEK